MTAAAQYVGKGGAGTFTQSAGTNTLVNGYSGGSLYLGYNTGDKGTYNLSGTGLAVNGRRSEYVGYSGTGTLPSRVGATRPTAATSISATTAAPAGPTT